MKFITITDDEATVEARARAIASDEGTYDPDEMIYLAPGVTIDGEEVVPFWKLFKNKARATLEADRQRAVGGVERLRAFVNEATASTDAAIRGRARALYAELSKNCKEED